MVMADNGYFSSVDDIVINFKEHSKMILNKTKKVEKRLGRCIRDGDLDNALLKEYTSLTLDVKKAVEQVTNSYPNILKAQIDTYPSHLIGVEDFTVAALLKLNIEPYYLNLDRQFFKNINIKVSRQAVDYMEKIPPNLSQNYYPVASAISYDTAFDAGEVFAKAGIEKIAIGFGAYLNNRRKIDFVDFRGKRILFEESLPSSYIRTGAISKGFWDGYTSSVGKAPEAFHFLGMGVPIILGLNSLFSWGTSKITFDATSPIKDAFSGSIYLYKPSFLKTKNSSICTKLVQGKITEWDCPCPFCREFTKRYPFDYTKGAQWFNENHREVKEDDLVFGGVISQAYPLFSKLYNNSLGKEIRLARIGHNYWVLNKIMDELNENSNSLKKLRNYMGNIVENYEKTAMSSTWIQAVKFLYENANNI